MCRGACFVTLQDAEVCDSLDYSGGVCGYVGHGEGDLVFEAGLGFMLPKARMPCIAMYEDNEGAIQIAKHPICLLYTSPSPRDATLSRMPSSA